MNLGYDTLLATNGREAVEMAAIHLPDLILMDIMLPEMDGLEATRLIRGNSKTNTIPILAATARVTMRRAVAQINNLSALTELSGYNALSYSQLL